MNPSDWLSAKLTQVVIALAQAGAALEPQQPAQAEPTERIEQ